MKKQKGQAMTEYILIVGMIVIIAIVGVKLFGGSISGLFTATGVKVVTEANSGLPATPGK